MGFLRAAAAAVFALVGMATTAAAQTPSPADQQCLACHGMPGLEKKLGDGETLPLQIAGDDFSKSVHAPLGCATCHSDVQPGQNHPPAENNIPSRRAFALERVQVWQTCHASKPSSGPTACTRRWRATTTPSPRSVPAATTRMRS